MKIEANQINNARKLHLLNGLIMYNANLSLCPYSLYHSLYRRLQIHFIILYHESIKVYARRILHSSLHMVDVNFKSVSLLFGQKTEEKA